MKYTIFLLFFLINSQVLNGQVFPIDTILYNGPWPTRIDLVFLGDGYQENEFDKYHSDVEMFTQALFSQSPFKEYKSHFNVFAILVPSNQSGVDHPQLFADVNLNCAQTPKQEVDSYFNSTFDSFGMHQLIVPDGGKIRSVLSYTYPAYDAGVLIINSPHYGGSGGQFTTFSTSQEGPETFLHEFGHSFGDLADEYWAGPQYAFEKPNLTQTNNPSTIKWKKWLNTNGIGIFSIPGKTGGWYRPHQNCKMQVPGFPYCNVCAEALLEKIHTLSVPIIGVSPTPGFIQIYDYDPKFEIYPINPQPNTLRTIWKLNNKVIARDTSVIVVDKELLNDGFYKEISAEILDTTILVRVDSHFSSHSYQYVWKVDGLITGIENDERETNYAISAWPNPTDSKINVSFTVQRSTVVSINFRNQLGQSLIRHEDKFTTGTHYLDFALPVNGIYLMTLTFDGVPISRKLIRK